MRLEQNDIALHSVVWMVHRVYNWPFMADPYRWPDTLKEYVRYQWAIRANDSSIGLLPTVDEVTRTA